MRKLVFILSLAFVFLSAHSQFVLTIAGGPDTQGDPDTSYVAASGGNNANPGTNAEPWATLAYAVDNVSAGDYIWMQTGTHTITDTIEVPIGVNIRGTDTSSTIINVTAGGTASEEEWNGTLVLRSVAGTSGSQSISYIKFTGNDTASIAIVVAGRSNVEIMYNRFMDFKYYGVVFSSYQGYGLTTSADPPPTYATGNSFHHNTMFNNAGFYGIYARGNIAMGGQEGPKLYNNIIDQPLRPSSPPASALFPGYCYKNYDWGHNKGMEMYNEDYTMPPDPVSVVQWNIAAEFWLGKGGLNIHDCTFRGTVDFAGAAGDDPTKAGFQKGDYDYSWWIHDCVLGPDVLGNTDEVGAFIEASQEDGRFGPGNRIKNVRDGIFFVTNSAWTDSVNRITIEYNEFDSIGELDDNTGYAIRWSDGETTIVVQDIHIYNNVMRGTTTSNTIVGVSLPDVGEATGTEVVNNIIQDFDLTAIYADLSGGQTITGTTLDNNDLYNNADDTTWVGDPTSGMTFANNTTADPLYINPFDHHLQASSVGVGGGKDLSLSLDAEGVAVGNPPNIGAFETIGLDAATSFIVTPVGVGDDSSMTNVVFDQDADSVRQNTLLGITVPARWDSDSLITASSDTTGFDGQKRKRYEDADTTFTDGLWIYSSSAGLWTLSQDTSRVYVGSANCGVGTSDYGETGATTATSTTLADFMYAMKVTVTTCGEVTKLSAYVGTTTAANSKMAIYDDDSDAPGSLITNGATDEISQSSDQYNDYTFSTNPNVDSGVAYWIVVFSNQTPNISEGGAPTIHYESTEYDSGFPANFTSGGTINRDMGLKMTVNHEVVD